MSLLKGKYMDKITEFMIKVFERVEPNHMNLQRWKEERGARKGSSSCQQSRFGWEGWLTKSLPLPLDHWRSESNPMLAFWIMDQYSTLNQNRQQKTLILIKSSTLTSSEVLTEWINQNAYLPSNHISIFTQGLQWYFIFHKEKVCPVF